MTLYGKKARRASRQTGSWNGRLICRGGLGEGQWRWERANGDGVCHRAWCMRAVCAAAPAAIEPGRGLASELLAIDGGATCKTRASSRLQITIHDVTRIRKLEGTTPNLCCFGCAPGSITGESNPEKDRERGRAVAAYKVVPWDEGRRMLLGWWF